ncbi:MAG: hypothetical protein Q9225_003770 [Loekoesia sp. 1 TL-2023]
MFSKRLFLLLLFIRLLVQATPTPSPPSGPQPSLKPGNDQEDADACQDYKSCSVKGLGYWNKLDEALRDPQYQDRTDGTDKFQKFYTSTFDDTMPSDPDLRQDLVTHGLNANYLDMWTTKEKNSKANKFFSPFLNAFDTNGGAIIALANWRQFDKTQQLPWSELMYQTWKAASKMADHENLYGIFPGHPKGGPISNLKCVVQHIVTNDGTKGVMKTMYEKNRYSIGQGDMEWKKWTEEDSLYWFYALLGTDNVRGTVWLLRDHANEIGRKTVTEIWTRWEAANPDIWYVVVS